MIGTKNPTPKREFEAVKVVLKPSARSLFDCLPTLKDICGKVSHEVGSNRVVIVTKDNTTIQLPMSDIEEVHFDLLESIRRIRTFVNAASERQRVRLFPEVEVGIRPEAALRIFKHQQFVTQIRGSASFNIEERSTLTVFRRNGSLHPSPVRLGIDSDIQSAHWIVTDLSKLATRSEDDAVVRKRE